MRRTIPLRETLTADIFEEMTESYPLTAVDGRQYKQDLQFVSTPSDFDYVKFRFDLKNSSVGLLEAFGVWNFLMSQMCLEYGYYCYNTEHLIAKISFALELDEKQIKAAIDVLIEKGYLYEFDGRYTNIPAVRNFEVVQSTRIKNRNGQKAYKDKLTKTDEDTPTGE